jgi:hypothetical protein
MIKFLKKLDNYIDKKWRETCAVIFYYFDKRVQEEDIDWLNMQNDIIQRKGDKK